MQKRKPVDVKKKKKKNTAQKFIQKTYLLHEVGVLGQ